MKKIILILLILILTGCGILPGIEKKAETIDIHKGTEGVKITLINPNPKIIEEQSIFLIAQLENKGATDVQEEFGFYNIITGAYIDVTSPEKSQGNYKLDGKSQYNPIGELKQIEIKGKSKELPKQTEHYKTQIAFQTCYSYSTKARPQVCIDTDPTNKKPKSCRVEAQSLSGGQGAPVEITRIEPMMMQRDEKIMPAFLIYIKNSGNGFIINKTDVEKACRKEGKIVYNVIYPEVRIGTKNLDCGKIAKIKMIGKEAKIFCKIKDEDAYTKKEGVFNTILEIDLEYGYETTESTTIDITKIA